MINVWMMVVDESFRIWEIRGFSRELHDEHPCHMPRLPYFQTDWQDSWTSSRCACLIIPCENGSTHSQGINKVALSQELWPKNKPVCYWGVDPLAKSGPQINPKKYSRSIELSIIPTYPMSVWCWFTFLSYRFSRPLWRPNCKHWRRTNSTFVISC